MALVTPVFFLLVFALMEFSRTMMVQQALTDAARAGCRKGVIATTTTNSQVEAAARAHLQSFMDESTARITVQPANFGEVERGTEITTTVEVNYPDVAWVPLGFMTNKTLRSQAKMERE